MNRLNFIYKIAVYSMSKKYIISLLTSSKLEYLIESYFSLVHQKNHYLDYDILIMVNSLNPNYYKEVIYYFQHLDIEKDFKNKVIITQSDSNGKPGKGHNSVLNFFKTHSEYDYILTFDGDDFLYPCALERIQSYLQYNPDICMLPFSDILNSQYSQCYGIPLKNNIFLNFNNYSTNMLKTWQKHKLSPFDNHIHFVNTAGRLIFVSRKALELELYYDENMGLFDDVHIFLQVFEASILNKNLNIFMLYDCDIFLYNRLNEDSVTEKLNNKIIDINDENKHLINSIQNKFFAIRDWDLSKLIFLTNKKNDSFSILDKINFADELVNKFDYDGPSFMENIHMNIYLNYAIQFKDDVLFKEYEKRKIKYLNNLIFFIYDGQKDKLIKIIEQIKSFQLKNNINNFDIMVLTHDNYINEISNLIKNTSIQLKVNVVQKNDLINYQKNILCKLFYLKFSNYYNNFLYLDINHDLFNKINVFDFLVGKNILGLDLNECFYGLSERKIDELSENKIDKILKQHLDTTKDKYIVHDYVLLFNCNINTYKCLLLMNSISEKNKHLTFKEVLNIILYKNNMLKTINIS